MNANACPPDAVLKAFHAGDLDDDTADDVTRHAEGCASCEARLTAFDALPDTLADLIRHSTKGKPMPVDDAVMPEYVGGYQILAEVGRGGMGVVYKARQSALNRLAAVKMIIAGRYATAEDQIRFRLEAEVLARVRHPNIVQVFEAGRHGERPFLALEWVGGGTAERLVREGGVPPREAAELAEQIARGVHSAHTCGVLHRDLKPANVLLTADGVPKVTDFGLAKLLNGGDTPTLSVTGTFLGTPNYMAPEQAKGGVIGPQADVYAVGAVLFALLTGRPPFTGEFAYEIVEAVLHQSAPSVSRLKAGVPRDLVTICARCLEKEPARRYTTAADLADDLRRWLDGRPIVARPVPFWERAWLAARRRPSAAALVAVTLFALIGGVAVAGWQWREAVQARFDAENRERQAVAAKKEADGARGLAELREARRAIEKGLLLCDRWDVALGLEWLERGRIGAERGGDKELAAVAHANIAAWSTRLMTHTFTASREPLPRIRAAFPAAADTVAYSRSGQHAATAGRDLWIDLWRVTDGKLELRTQKPLAPIVLGKSSIVRCLRFSPTDEFTLAVGIANGYAGIVSMNPDEEPRMIHRFAHPDDEVWSVAFSPDGQTLLTGCGDGIARAWPIKGGKPVEFKAPPGSSNSVQAVAYIPAPPGLRDARPLVLTAGRGWGARVWREDGTPLVTIGNEREQVFSVATAWHGNQLRVLLGLDRSAQVWQADLRRANDGWGLSDLVELSPSMAHTHRVTSVSLTPDGRTGMTADHGGMVRVWDVDGGRLLFQPVQHGDELRDAVLRPDAGEMIACGSDALIKVWKLPAMPWSGPTVWHGTGILNAFYTPTGDLVTASGSNMRLWDHQKPGAVRQLWHRGADRGTLALFVTPGPGGDGFFIAATGSSQNVLAAPGGGSVRRFPHRALSTGAAFSPDSQLLLTLYSGFDISEPSLRLWKLQGDTATLVSKWGERTLGRARAAAFRPPTGREILVGCASNEVVWLDAETGRSIAPPEKLPAPANVVAYRVDGSAAVVGCQGGAVRCWTSGTRSLLGPGFQAGSSVRSIVFTPDGSGLLTGLSDGTARLWDVATGLQIGPALGHIGSVTEVRFTPDGRSILTAGSDGAARVWKSFGPSRP